MNNSMKKRIGIYSVLDKHKDLTKRMNEDARYNLTNKLDEADDENNLENPDQTEDTDNQSVDLGIEGGLSGGNDDSQPKDNEMDNEDDMLDLDALGDEDLEGTGMEEPSMQEPTMEPDQTTDMGGEPTEEIDVTDFVERGTELTQKVDTQVQTMSQQIDTLTQKLSTMDQLLNKIQQVEDEIHAMRPPKPIETLKLRSLDSYPYNQGIDDYWKQKEVEIEKLRNFNRVDNQEYVLTNDDVNNYSDIEIKDSLNPNVQQSMPPFGGPKTNQQTPSRFNRQEHS